MWAKGGLRIVLLKWYEKVSQNFNKSCESLRVLLLGAKC